MTRLMEISEHGVFSKSVKTLVYDIAQYDSQSPSKDEAMRLDFQSATLHRNGDGMYGENDECQEAYRTGDWTGYAMFGTMQEELGRLRSPADVFVALRFALERIRLNSVIFTRDPTQHCKTTHPIRITNMILYERLQNFLVLFHEQPLYRNAVEAVMRALSLTRQTPKTIAFPADESGYIPEHAFRLGKADMRKAEFVLGSVTHFSAVLSICGFNDPVLRTRQRSIDYMLPLAKNLQTLCLIYTEYPSHLNSHLDVIMHLLSFGAWPNLQALKLMHLDVDIDIVKSFLGKHAKLSTLQVVSTNGDLWGQTSVAIADNFSSKKGVVWELNGNEAEPSDLVAGAWTTLFPPIHELRVFHGQYWTKYSCEVGDAACQMGVLALT